MSEKMKENNLNEVSGGGASGNAWQEHGMTYYYVEEGDNLFDISMRFGTTCEAIKALNPKLITDINRIVSGWTIRIF